MPRIFTAAEIEDVLSLDDLLGVVRTGLIEQAAGRVERPPRPHFPVGRGIESDEPLGTGLTMSAYVHGADYYVTKLAAVHERNANTDRPTVHAQIVLTDARSGEPLSLMDGTLVTSARTGCIGGLSVRALTDGPVSVGVLGAGTQARWQARAIAAATTVESVRIYSPSDSKHRCAADLRADGIEARAVETPAEAVAGADVVVTATTSTEPVFPAASLENGAVVVAVGAYTADMQELDSTVLDGAATVFADVPSEVAEIGDFLASGLSESELIPLGSLLSGELDRPSSGETVVVESVGSAVLDAVAAEHLYDAACAEGLGRDFEL